MSKPRRIIPKWIKDGKESTIVYVVGKVIEKRSKEEQLEFLIKLVKLLKNKMARLRLEMRE